MSDQISTNSDQCEPNQQPAPTNPAPSNPSNSSGRPELLPKPAQTRRRHRRRRGGQPGNQNARKHGFYCKTVPPELRHKLYDASDVQGLDEEINMLRTKLAIAGESGVDYRHLVPGIALLQKLVNGRKKLKEETDDKLTDAFARAWAQVLPPGIKDVSEAYCILSDYVKSRPGVPPAGGAPETFENAASNQIE